MGEESLYLRQLQDILEQSGVYEETKAEMETLLNTSVFRNALTLGTRLNQVYQGLRADCDDSQGVRDDVDNIRGEMVGSGELIHANVAERAVASPQGAMHEYAVIQRQADGRMLQQRFGTLNDCEGSKLQYEISLWNQDLLDGEPSYVDLSLELPGGYKLKMSYTCDEYGEPYAGQLRDHVIKYTHADEPCEVISSSMVESVAQFLEDWDMQLSENQ